MSEQLAELIRQVESARKLIIDERHRQKVPCTEIECIALSTLASVQVKLENLFQESKKTS